MANNNDRHLDIPCRQTSDGRVALRLWWGEIPNLDTGEKMGFWYIPWEGDMKPYNVIIGNTKMGNVVMRDPDLKPDTDAFKALCIDYADHVARTGEDERYVVITKENWSRFNKDYIDFVWPVPVSEDDTEPEVR